MLVLALSLDHFFFFHHTPTAVVTFVWACEHVSIPHKKQYDIFIWFCFIPQYWKSFLGKKVKKWQEIYVTKLWKFVPKPLIIPQPLSAQTLGVETEKVQVAATSWSVTGAICFRANTQSTTTLMTLLEFNCPKVYMNWINGIYAFLCAALYTERFFRHAEPLSAVYLSISAWVATADEVPQRKRIICQ